MESRKRQNALILDDEPLFEGLFKIMMARLDWDCEVVASRERAVDRLKEAHFNVLITEYRLSQGNGLHFICCLRQEGINLPAIVMSGDANILQMVPKDLLTIPAVLLKPFTASDLRDALDVL